MEEKEYRPLESLFEKGEEFGKTSFELIKLQALDKSTIIASAVVFNIVIILLFSLFFLMATIGAAIWIGGILGQVWYGFFAVAGFYAIIWIVVYFFMHDWIKKIVSNSIIKHVLK